MHIAVAGNIGSGKTTLLKALCGILPHEGTCTLDQTVLEKQSPKQIARMISYIPQRSGISIDISPLDVVLMGFNPRLGLLERPTKEMKDAAVQALHRVGLSGREEMNYLHLSEGQKQLCILARTMVSESRLLLLDEPLAALDLKLRQGMQIELKNLQIKAYESQINPHFIFNTLQIVQMLSDGEKCGCKLLEAFEITQPTLSHHMKILCECGIVIAEKDWKWIYYSQNTVKLKEVEYLLSNMR